MIIRQMIKEDIENGLFNASKENCKRIELNCWAFNEKALSLYENIGFIKQRIILEKTIN